MKRSSLTFFSVLLLGMGFFGSRPAFAGVNQLQLAISTCDVETVNRLLQSGADPNAKDFRGKPILGWFASGQKCNDARALATVKLLDERGAQFQNLEGTQNPSLLVNLAPRGLPETLAFLSKKKGAGDPTQALHSIARKNDLASIRVLLSAGADPLDGVALSSSLLDATSAGQGPSVSEMLKHVQDKQSKKVQAAYELATKNSDPKIAQVFLEAGVKPVLSETSPKTSPCERKKLTPAQAQLLSKIGLPNASGLSGLAGQMNCQFVQACGDLVLIDCNSAADGPAYYINQKTNQLLATCGGACMKGCTGCPPQEWTCECKL